MVYLQQRNILRSGLWERISTMSKTKKIIILIILILFCILMAIGGAVMGIAAAG